MDRQQHSHSTDSQPGVWSTDDYIRKWTVRHRASKDLQLIPLQSLHGFWMARVRLDEPGQPVERFAVDATDEAVESFPEWPAPRAELAR